MVLLELVPAFISAVRDQVQLDPFHTTTDPVALGVPGFIPPWEYLLSKYDCKFDTPIVTLDRPDLLRVNVPLELLQEPPLT